jgi:hypothetical protein
MITQCLWLCCTIFYIYFITIHVSVRQRGRESDTRRARVSCDNRECVWHSTLSLTTDIICKYNVCSIKIHWGHACCLLMCEIIASSWPCMGGPACASYLDFDSVRVRGTSINWNYLNYWRRLWPFGGIWAAPLDFDLAELLTFDLAEVHGPLDLSWPLTLLGYVRHLTWLDLHPCWGMWAT